ncbi:MAG: pyruvate ferredoxin oxidoreductase [Firmicutes bacterium]|nr:pyruvate ferredoxin oxidoreductase [Bacillota bacterium]
MVANLRELSQQESFITSGHRMCAGCIAPVVARMVSMAAKDRNVVIANATGCLEVATTIYPYTAWKCSWIHNAFENAAATISGVEAAYKSLKRQGKIKDDYKFIAFGGDGGTYDIGIQALSGAVERGHDLVYVCYDNGAYMNTGIQRSGATPKFADTTTSPAGDVVPGKTQWRKDLTAIMAAHNIPYAAQASPGHWNDFISKAKKAIDVNGSAFINAFAPCPRGWRYNTSDGIEICRLAVDTCVWPLYEVVDGEWKVTYKPRKKRPVADFLKAQGRFRHLTPEMIQEYQDRVDRDWEALLKRSGEA